MEILLETKRLILRQWEESDKRPFFEMNSDPDVMKYFPSPLSRKESDKFFEKLLLLIEKQGFGLYPTVLKETGHFIGFIGLNEATFKASFTPCIEIGWRLHKDYWKKGFATEGAIEVLKFGFQKLGKKEILSFTSKLNTPSIKVMERLGMQKFDEFEHPNIEEGHPLRSHVLYKIHSSNRFKVFK